MKKMTQDLQYQTAGPEALDEIRSLWEHLRQHHRELPWPFALEMDKAAFETRKQELLAKSEGGFLRIDTVTGSAQELIAYCASSVSKDYCGEIDSMFVLPAWRGQGIGTELVRRSILWLDEMGSVRKQVVVAHANTHALDLYAKFGFIPRTITMQQEERP
jgi:GNAT superfamily N-acetyltransferase